MLDYYNPFEYEAAKKFTSDQILDFYIEDSNYSRFIRSRRNIFLIGERGTGKTMTFLYNSFLVQQKQAVREARDIDFNLICVYIPCNTPLTHRREYQLLEPFQASIISEHFLVLVIMDAIIHTLSKIPYLLDGVDNEKLREDLEFSLDIKIPQDRSLFDALKLSFQREVTKAQREINTNRIDAFYETAIGFSSGVMPLVNCLRKIPRLSESHFSLMLDDAQDLNQYQIQVLNSWIAYRDNSAFSFKVATTKVNRPSLLTSSGGAILEGHDFTTVDMEQPYQNRYSDFSKLACGIIERRLKNIGVAKPPDEFFPTNPHFKKDIQECERQVRIRAQEKMSNPTTKQINDYVYKYGRAEYFRQRSAKANLPPYSGLEILIHLSTGVIRNLLEPCYWMYDKAISDMRSKGNFTSHIEFVPHSIQNSIILDRSRRKWEWIKEGLDRSIDGCSRDQTKQVYQLFDNLAIHFKERLLYHPSEPRAIVFTISETRSRFYPKLMELLDVARKAQILYTHTSSAKDEGRRETYYVPNRILWPERGLDPVGQYSRVSLKTSELWLAATQNKRIHPIKQDNIHDIKQLRLYHE